MPPDQQQERNYIKKINNVPDIKEEKMRELIAYCGLDCNQCGAYIATVHNDDARRAETAERWSKEYKTNFKPEDINCMGCTARSRKLFQHCNVCEIRRCAMEMEVTNCAYCSDYACDKLEKFFGMVPDARKRLDVIRVRVTI